MTGNKAWLVFQGKLYKAGAITAVGQVVGSKDAGNIGFVVEAGGCCDAFQFPHTETANKERDKLIMAIMIMTDQSFMTVDKIIEENVRDGLKATPKPSNGHKIRETT